MFIYLERGVSGDSALKLWQVSEMICRSACLPCMMARTQYINGR